MFYVSLSNFYGVSNRKQPGFRTIQSEEEHKSPTSIESSELPGSTGLHEIHIHQPTESDTIIVGTHILVWPQH